MNKHEMDDDSSAESLMPIEVRRVDKDSVRAYVPRDAFARTGTRIDGRYAVALTDDVVVMASPGTALSIAWLVEHANDPGFSPFIPRHLGRVDEGAIWAKAARAAAQSSQHPASQTTKSYPDVVWSDAVAKALGLPLEAWKRMENEANVSVKTWPFARHP